MKEIGVGILGFGTVGAGVAEGLLRNRRLMAERLGVDIVLKRIADVDITTDRGVRVDPDILTTDAQAVIAAPDVRIIVETIGGTGVARTFVLAALNAGKAVVTANKKLLAQGRGHRQQEAPRGTRQGDFRHGEEERRGHLLRRVRGRRHPDHPQPPRGTRRQRDTPDPRHPQRHVQLHPHAHGERGQAVRRGPRRRPEARLRRGEPVPRHRRLRHGAQGVHPLRPRLRLPAVARPGAGGGHPQPLRPRREVRRRLRLPHQAARRRASSCSPSWRGTTRTSRWACTPRSCRSPTCSRA